MQKQPPLEVVAPLYQAQEQNGCTYLVVSLLACVPCWARSKGSLHLEYVLALMYYFTGKHCKEGYGKYYQAKLLSQMFHQNQAAAVEETTFSLGVRWTVD